MNKWMHVGVSTYFGAFPTIFVLLYGNAEKYRVPQIYGKTLPSNYCLYYCLLAK
eukprot:SAG31_NODE_984_length_10552_cov_4.679231_11_plen_54_part_00